jgi:hypothetical protein
MFVIIQSLQLYSNITGETGACQSVATYGAPQRLGPGVAKNIIHMRVGVTYNDKQPCILEYIIEYGQKIFIVQAFFVGLRIMTAKI